MPADINASVDASGENKAGQPALRGQQRKPLGQRLLDAGIITDIQLDAALREQKRTGAFLGDALVSLGFVTHEVLAGMLAEDARTTAIDILAVTADERAMQLIPYDLARHLRVMPIALEDDCLVVAMADTFDIVAVDALEKKSGMHVRVVGAPEGDILDALERHYAQTGSIEETAELLMQQDADAEAADESPMIRLVNQVIARGINSNATDIHIEPGEKIIQFRLRVDGVLRKIALLPKQLMAGVSTRIKIMAGMDVTERRIPQDGRIRFNLGRRRVDLRTSTLPTSHGESIVMRILDQNPKALSLEQLGMSNHNRTAFARLISQPHGIVLITGPTGSGKTTTLYTALGQINAQEKSIFTLEDPVEYSLPMIRQTQVNSDVGLTFAAGLRALLRQDPDVILIGEMRDQETASLAVRAALTGHLVFSTLHTNDAASAIPRLIDMGIEPYLLPSCLTGIVAQRLLRRICPACKHEIEQPAALLEQLGLRLSGHQGSGEGEGDTGQAPRLRLWRGEGCDACHQTGYAGRTAIHEVMTLSNRFHDAILKGASVGEIRKMAADGGMRSLMKDGLARALAGETTVEEVLRVAQAE